MAKQSKYGKAKTFDLNAAVDAFNRDKGKTQYVKDDKVFRPEPGKYNIRILPGGEDDEGKTLTSNPNLFFEQIAVHRLAGVNTKYVGCLKIMANQRCPVCNFVSRLYDSKDEGNIQLARDIKRYTRYMLNVIVRGQEDKGVQVWKIGDKIRVSIIEGLKTLNDEEQDWDVTHPITGRDYVLNVSPISGQKWFDYSGTFKFSPSPIAETEEQIDAILAARFDLTKQYNPDVLSQSELQQLLVNYLNENGLDNLLGFLPAAASVGYGDTSSSIGGARVTRPAETEDEEPVKPAVKRQTIAAAASAAEEEEEEEEEQDEKVVVNTDSDKPGKVSARLKKMIDSLDE